jgi:hypothetical protein
MWLFGGSRPRGRDRAEWQTAFDETRGVDGSTGFLFTITPDDVAQKLAEFEGVWEALHYSEQTQLIQSLIESVRCDGLSNAKIAFRMHESLHIESR